MQKPRVFKFGGTSVGTPHRLASALSIVRDERAHGPLAVVVSAPGDTTDWLIDAGRAAALGDAEAALTIVDKIADFAEHAVSGALVAHGADWPEARVAIDSTLADLRRLLGGLAIVADLSPAARDHVLSFGERLSIKLVAGALAAIGVEAEAVDARTWTVTDDRFGSANILWDETIARVRPLMHGWLGTSTEGGASANGSATGDGSVTIHTGFLGATRSGVTTTLGRNGSDFTAALLGRALGASSVDIFTDVPGVMTADPTIEREAYPVPRLSYREALELAGLGMKMFHPRTMVPLLESGIPMRIRSTLRPELPGTVVDATGSADPNRPTCVVSLEDVALLSVEGTQRTEGVDLGPRAVAAVARAGIPLLFETLAAYGNGVALGVPGARRHDAEQAIAKELDRELARGDLAPPVVLAPVTVLTLVAEAMGRTVGVAARFFGALASIGVSALASAHGATSRAVSAVIDAGATANAVRAVHAAFNLAREQVNVALVGKGVVGSQVLAQIAAEREKLERDFDLALRVVAVADSRGALVDEDGLDPRTVEARLATDEPRVSLDEALARAAKLPVPVLVDCSAATGMDTLYVRALGLGMHVVAANKKPLVLPKAERQAIFDAARAAHRAYRYETTCGASLPIIETLKNLVRTGDRVRLVEGSLSGTLGFLSNEIARGVPLSRAVRDAKERGFTEPHPRDDLNGLDAGRKALILARELGLDAELEDVVVEPFVPAELLADDDLGAFFRALEGHDAAFAAKVAAMRAEGLTLRYLAQIEPAEGGGRPRLRVGPVGVPADHPATRLRGSEAFVAFTTDRYAEYPLVVQGSGAGGAVTAAGVLADVLALSQALRGR